MSLLPGHILPQTEIWGRADPNGDVTIDKNWWLFLYNLGLQVLGTGQGLPPSTLIEISATDADAADTDAIALRLPVSNALVQMPDISPAATDFPDIGRALLLAQDPPLQDPLPQAQPSAAITVGGSPFTYTAPFNGCITVTGGTVSLIQLIRQGVTIATGLTTGLIPASRLDQVRVTYTGLPTMIFLPT